MRHNIVQPTRLFGGSGSAKTPAVGKAAKAAWSHKEKAGKHILMLPIYVIGTALFLLATWAALHVLLWTVGFLFGEPDKGATAGETQPVIPHPTERETLVQYNADWRRNVWEPMETHAFVPYDMRQDEDRRGPWVYTGINCALAEGGKVKGQFPDHTGANTFALILGDPTVEEFLWSNERSIPISTWKALYLRSEVKRTPNQAFQGFVRLEDPADGAVRIRTFREGFRLVQQPDGSWIKVFNLPWGKLPDKERYQWDLYVRFAWSDGSELSEPELLKAHQPGVVVIRHPASDWGGYAEPQYTAQVTLPDTVYTGDGEPELTVIAPNLPFPTRVEVILRIRPR